MGNDRFVYTFCRSDGGGVRISCCADCWCWCDAIIMLQWRLCTFVIAAFMTTCLARHHGRFARMVRFTAQSCLNSQSAVVYYVSIRSVCPSLCLSYSCTVSKRLNRNWHIVSISLTQCRFAFNCGIKVQHVVCCFKFGQKVDFHRHVAIHPRDDTCNTNRTRLFSFIKL